MDTRPRIRLENEFQTTDVFLTPGRSWEQKLFTLSELLPTTLTYFGPGSLTIETKLGPENSVIIQDLIPGRYLVLWDTGRGAVYEGFFEVHPHSLTIDTMASMLNVLEQKIPGITQNPDFNNSAYQDLSLGQQDYREFMFLTSASQEVVTALSAIEKRPVESLYPIYEKTAVSRRQTPRSQRMLAAKGGSTPVPVYFEPKKKLTRDTPENRYLKSLLTLLEQKVRLLCRSAQEKEHGIQNQVLAIRLENDLLLQNLTRLKDRNHTKVYADWQGRLTQGKQEEKRLEEEKNNYRERFHPLLELKARLQLFLALPWIANLPAPGVVEFPRSIVKYRGYMEIFQVIQDLQQKNFNGRFQYPRFPTTKLFEFYAFIFCHELLLSKSLRPSQKLSCISALEPMEYQISGGGGVRLSYDRLVKDAASARQSGQPQIVSLMGSRRPDVLLELLGPCGRLLGALVVEVKYRRLKYLYTAGADTDVVQQLNSYSLFARFEPQKPLERSLPVQVCVLYPKYGDAALVTDSVLGYDFIPVMPTTFDLRSFEAGLLSDKIEQLLSLLPATPVS